jgi:peptidoglycan/xylan/chitin deacetylase (PgdA/CDA1 family)
MILGYHRISDTTWDPLNLAVSRNNFRSQLQVLSDIYRPVSLMTLLEMKRKGMSLKGYVSITFDDGCEDFIQQAVPELARRNIPATVFVTTGYAGKRFWWDEVSFLMSHINADVDQVEVDAGSADGKRVYRNLSSQESAANAVREICEQLLYLKPSARSEIINGIRRHTAEDTVAAAVPRAMTRGQLQDLSRTEAVEIAAHTVTHPMLSQLGEAEQLGEIQRSKSDLEAFGSAVRGFSYPNGSFSSQTARLVEDCGFEYACTSWQAAVRRSTDRYQLPRVWVPNVGGQEFRRWMSVWSGLRD